MLVLVRMAVTVMVHLFLLRVLVLVVVMVVLVFHRLLDPDRRLVDLLVDDLLLLDDGRLVVVVDALCVRVRVLVALLLDRDVNDDLLLFHVAVEDEPMATINDVVYIPNPNTYPPSDRPMVTTSTSSSAHNICEVDTFNGRMAAERTLASKTDPYTNHSLQFHFVCWAGWA